MTSNSFSLNNCTKTISYKYMYVYYINAKASKCQSKYPILDQLSFATSSLQENCTDTIRLKNLIKKFHVFFNT